jgi:hypothetical protein
VTQEEEPYKASPFSIAKSATHIMRPLQKEKIMWKDRIKREFNENPAQTIMVGALAVTAMAKLLDVLSSVQSRRAYANQINRKN